MNAGTLAGRLTAAARELQAGAEAAERLQRRAGAHARCWDGCYPCPPSCHACGAQAAADALRALHVTSIALARAAVLLAGA